jgi:molybdopterin-guanine dinucleotide biosynthesis protein A
VNIAAALLTGGASRRMGRDKASLILGAAGPGMPEALTPDPETLAARTARLLRAVADPVIEVGGSVTDLPRVADRRPRAGPLAALADAAGALRAESWSGPVLVVATDLPRLSVGLLAWLAGHPIAGALVPLDRTGRPQPLCARYPWAALELAEDLVAGGATRMGALLEVVNPLFCPPSEWAGPAGGSDVLVDVDTPADLADLIDGPPTGAGPSGAARRRGRRGG